MQIGIAEFLEKVSKLKTNKEKVEALKANDTYVLRVILQSVFDPGVKWLVPQGQPPYTPNQLMDQEGILINDIRKIQYFVEGFHNIPDKKRQMMFIELLERVAPADAELLIAMKDKTLPYDGIDFYHAYEALPGLFPNCSPPAEPEENGGENKAKSFREEATVVCPHCGVAGKTERMMKQYHFDNCKKRTQEEHVEKQVSVNVVQEVKTTEPVPNENGVYVAPDLSSLQEFKS
jgi:hypothetical protein